MVPGQTVENSAAKAQGGPHGALTGSLAAAPKHTCPKRRTRAQFARVRRSRAARWRLAPGPCCPGYIRCSLVAAPRPPAGLKAAQSAFGRLAPGQEGGRATKTNRRAGKKCLSVAGMISPMPMHNADAKSPEEPAEWFTCEGSIGTGVIRCDDESGASGSLMPRARRERAFLPPSAFTRWMAVVRAPIGVAWSLEPALSALSGSRSSARESRRGERIRCETRSVRCEDFYFATPTRGAGLAAPRLGPRNRWDPTKMSLEARVFHLGPPQLVVCAMCSLTTLRA